MPIYLNLSYPFGKRYLLFAFMVALLPIRGWIGNAMATDMALQQVLMAQNSIEGATSASAKELASASAAAMPEDCPMNAQSQDVKSVAGGQADKATSGCNCNSCELCAALASFMLPALASAAFTPHAEPASHGTRFSSAERVFSLKPPIS